MNSCVQYIARVIAHFSHICFSPIFIFHHLECLLVLQTHHHRSDSYLCVWSPLLETPVFLSAGKWICPDFGPLQHIVGVQEMLAEWRDEWKTPSQRWVNHSFHCAILQPSVLFHFFRYGAYLLVSPPWIIIFLSPPYQIYYSTGTNQLEVLNVTLAQDFLP